MALAPTPTRPTGLDPTSRRRTAVVLATLGTTLAGVAAWGLAADVAWLSQAFYAWAWWAWILLLDAFCVWRRGSSLLTTRRHLLGLLATSSVTFWFLFELLNLRFANWYYVGTIELAGPLTYLGAGLFVAAAFATVFVGMFEVFDALGAAGVLTKRGAPRALPPWLPGGLQLLGLAMALAAVLSPFYLAPLIWGSLTFLLDPWNYRRGNRSLLRDVEAGDGRAVWRLFLAGLISGLVWEGLNFAAPQKWIYTVRGLEDLKLFEMPLLGFLGFPALAFDAVTAFSLLSFALCGNVGWEHEDDLAAPAAPRPHPRTGLALGRYWRTLPVQVVLWVGITALLMPRSIGSVRLRLEHLPEVAAEGPAASEALRAAGVHWPRQLLAALEGDEADALADGLGWDVARRERVARQAELWLFKGIGSWFGPLLEGVGVDTVQDLASWDPIDLHAVLAAEAAARGVKAPREDWVRVWVLASRSRGVLLRAG